MYKPTIKHILITILATDLLIKNRDIHTFDRFDSDLKLSDTDFNNLLYFAEMNFKMDLSAQNISVHSRISDLVACIYNQSNYSNQFALKSA
ncbi:hypothetical protein [uncultured Cytophaga sp.]|uniref:hypothetical protein n=1 Tax=uncultured Cytophaga sp. TaxID=160238 RepID=UPI0026185A00|nr:hypothetical protein [uncultured Cytophaga sp.]